MWTLRSESLSLFAEAFSSQLRSRGQARLSSGLLPSQPQQPFWSLPFPPPRYLPFPRWRSLLNFPRRLVFHFCVPRALQDASWTLQTTRMCKEVSKGFDQHWSSSILLACKLGWKKVAYIRKSAHKRAQWCSTWCVAIYSCCQEQEDRGLVDCEVQVNLSVGSFGERKRELNRLRSHGRLSITCSCHLI